MSDSKAAMSWWESAADELSKASARWNNHPLMDKLLISIYEYLEQKAKETAT